MFRREVSVGSLLVLPIRRLPLANRILLGCVTALLERISPVTVHVAARSKDRERSPCDWLEFRNVPPIQGYRDANRNPNGK